MSRKRYYLFKFDNGQTKYFTPQEALDYVDTENVLITHNGYQKAREAPKMRIKDGFQSGYNPALGCHVGGQRHYNRLLKERGLVEAGKEKINPQSTKDIEYKFEHSELKDMKDIAPSISDRLLDSMAKD